MMIPLLRRIQLFFFTSSSSSFLPFPRSLRLVAYPSSSSSLSPSSNSALISTSSLFCSSHCTSPTRREKEKEGSVVTTTHPPIRSSLSLSNSLPSPLGLVVVADCPQGQLIPLYSLSRIKKWINWWTNSNHKRSRNHKIKERSPIKGSLFLSTCGLAGHIFFFFFVVLILLLCLSTLVPFYPGGASAVSYPSNSLLFVEGRTKGLALLLQKNIVGSGGG